MSVLLRVFTRFCTHKPSFGLHYNENSNANLLWKVTGNVLSLCNFTMDKTSAQKTKQNAHTESNFYLHVYTKRLKSKVHFRQVRVRRSRKCEPFLLAIRCNVQQMLHG